MYIIWYAIEWLVSWLRRPPLLWSGLDILAILIEIYSFYVVIAGIKIFINNRRLKKQNSLKYLKEYERLKKRKEL